MKSKKAFMPLKMSLHARFFTLLEMLVVFFLLSFAIGLSSFKIKEMVEEQRFISQSEQLLSQLSMAQELMLILDADALASLIFSQKGQEKGLTLKLDFEKPLEKEMSKLVERELFLPAIDSIAFEGENKKELKLRFSLGDMPKGVLTISSKNGKEHRSIYFQGYPAPLNFKAKAQLKKLDREIERSKELYPAQVYEALYGT